METCKAAVVTGFGDATEVRDVLMPDLEPGGMPAPGRGCNAVRDRRAHLARRPFAHAPLHTGARNGRPYRRDERGAVGRPGQTSPGRRPRRLRLPVLRPLLLLLHRESTDAYARTASGSGARGPTSRHTCWAAARNTTTSLPARPSSPSPRRSHRPRPPPPHAPCAQ